MHHRSGTAKTSSLPPSLPPYQRWGTLEGGSSARSDWEEAADTRGVSSCDIGRSTFNVQDIVILCISLYWEQLSVQKERKINGRGEGGEEEEEEGEEEGRRRRGRRRGGGGGEEEEGEEEEGEEKEGRRGEGRGEEEERGGGRRRRGGGGKMEEERWRRKRRPTGIDGTQGLPETQ